MERNHIIGILLILAVVFLWNQYLFTPELKQKEIQQRTQDSLAALSQQLPLPEQKSIPAQTTTPSTPTIQDSGHVFVEEQTISLENDLLKIDFSSKGGTVKKVLLKNFSKIIEDSLGTQTKKELLLMEDPKNIFGYTFKHSQQLFSTQHLDFKIERLSDREIKCTAYLPQNASFTQHYTLDPDNYALQYSIRAENIQGNEPVQLHWENYLDKIELNYEYEKFNSSVYFKEVDKGADYCSCRSDDTKEIKEKRTTWFSHSHQFFNSSLISPSGFVNGRFETSFAIGNEDLKKIISDVQIPIEELSSKEYAMQWYIGPNEYKRLQKFNVELEDIVPYGWSIFGTINRYIIRPIFVVLNDYIGSKGLIILLMTLIVKLLVFPLAYKMLKSQAKMMALKPEIDKMKVKYKDDAQKQQMETMKLYNEFGVNPLGGCFPLLLQMPIWIALYRFFPTTIEFRQESFLWATDLTSYDVFMRLPFTIPFFGDTVSLFAFLWVISTVIFTYYSSKTMDFSANPAMIYMQYLMPFIFWFMFNKTAAGLTAYMFFSNLLNIAQTIIGKNYLFDHGAIRDKLELNKSKPKKQGGFQARLENMMKEQQKLQQEKEKKKK